MLYITGDTHGDFKALDKRLQGRGLTEDDVLLITGDFGFGWSRTMKELWRSFRRSPTVVFCDGNHENYDILNALPEKEMFGDVVGDFGNRTYRLLTGHMYTIEGLKTFVFGGAASIDREMRTDPSVVAQYGKIWWEEEIPSREQMDLALGTLERNGWRFDLFVSHTCPPQIKGNLKMPLLGFHDPTEDMIACLEGEILAHGGGWGSSWFGHFHTDIDLPENRHCRQNRISRIIDRTRYESVTLRKKSPQMELGL